MPALAIAPPAVRFFIDVPCVGICPGPVQIIRVTAGELFPIYVAAEYAPGFPDPGFTGTVTFSSTDPLATLPGPFTFMAADRGYHLFLNAGVLRTLGNQTISVMDSSGRLPTGSWNVTVDAPAGAILTTTATRFFGCVTRTISHGSSSGCRTRGTARPRYIRKSFGRPRCGRGSSRSESERRGTQEPGRAEVVQSQRPDLEGEGPLAAVERAP